MMFDVSTAKLDINFCLPVGDGGVETFFLLAVTQLQFIIFCLNGN